MVACLKDYCCSMRIQAVRFVQRWKNICLKEPYMLKMKLVKSIFILLFRQSIKNYLNMWQKQTFHTTNNDFLSNTIFPLVFKNLVQIPLQQIWRINPSATMKESLSFVPAGTAH